MGGDHASTGHASGPVTTHTATKQQMTDAKLPLAWRDTCAGLLITLNECRQKNFYMPFQCTHERHEYEVCQYKEYLSRQKEPAHK